MILFDSMIQCASDLLEPGEVHNNPEYLRGMAELIMVAFRMPISDKDMIIEAIEKQVIECPISRKRVIE